MPKNLIVRIVGDSTGFERSLKTSMATATGFERTLKRVSVTAQESAQAQIQASLRKDARLRSEITTYRAIAASAQKGSREQVIAANLAERAQRTLARSQSVTTAESVRLSKASHNASRELGAAARGAAAGSGIFRSLGRSIVFASGGFLAFGGASAFLRKSVDAAQEAQVANRQLAQQLKNDGKAFSDYRSEIDKTTNRLSALAGIQNDELKAGLVTILRTVPNVSKAERDLATATDLARAKHISLAQAATIIAKVEAGNTTLLRRQGLQIPKNAKAEQALAIVRQKLAGQAAAGTTQQERFGAVLHNTEEIIGTALLPTINRYLARGTVWLEQMNESGDLQRKVASAAHDFEGAVHDAGVVIHDVDRITGGFKNTLEILLALKVASWAGGITRSLTTVIGRFSAARGGAAALSGELAVGNASLAAQAGVASFALTTLTLKATGLDRQLRKAGGSAFDLLGHVPGAGKSLNALGLGAASFHTSNTPTDRPGQIGGVNVKNVELFAHTLLDAGRSTDQVFTAMEQRFASLSKDDLNVLLRIAETTRAAYTAAGGAAEEAGVKAAHGIALATQAAQQLDNTTAAISRHPINITNTQRNQFFDTKTQRALNRVADLEISQQIAALDAIENKIKARLAKTKDVTRQQTLEDQILEIERQKKNVRRQLRQDFLDSLATATGQADFAVQVAQTTKGFDDDIAALERLQRAIKTQIAAEGATADLEGQLFQARQDLAAARASKIAGRQFVALGLTPTGDQRIPGVVALRKALGNVSDEVAGTFLDTKKTRSLLSAIQRILSGGLGKVGEDVRAKIQQILGDLDRQIDDTTAKNLTKWRHLSSEALLAGVPDLTPAQRRALEKKLSALGPGGVVPGASTPAFSLQRPDAGRGGRTGSGGRGDDLVVVMDGEIVGRLTKNHQIRRAKKRSVPRSG